MQVLSRINTHIRDNGHGELSIHFADDDETRRTTTVTVRVGPDGLTVVHDRGGKRLVLMENGEVTYNQEHYYDLNSIMSKAESIVRLARSVRDGKDDETE